MTSRVTKQVLKEQIEALREENARLMDEIHGESLGASRDAGSLTVDESSTVTLEAHRQAMEDLQAELEDSQERSRELDRMCTGMDEQIRRLTMEAELDKLRAVEAEHSKWEAREERLVQQLRELQSQLSTTTRNQGDPSSAPAGSLSGAGVVTAEKDTNSTDLLGVVSATCTDKSTDNSNVRGVADSVDPLAANCMPTIDSMGSLLLAQQMPQITKFAGEDLDNEPFEDWLTQFEMIAGLCKWVGQAKLVHLTTRLRGPAFAFYRSCSAAQKSNYQLLVSELKKRFTPVHIQAVQTSRFHERRQKSGETVDDYAQELRKLFRKAYPTTARGSQETEQMGQTVLSSQFVAGLLPDIKSKVAGVEGDLEKLLTKARFEEAKLRELAEARKTLTVKPKANSEPSPSAANPAPSGGTPTNKNVQCHACGAWGHKAFQCPKRDRGLSKEAKQQTRTVHALTTEESPETEKQGQVTNHKQQLIDAEVDAALGEATVTMHTVTPVTKSDAPLGPVLTAEVELEGTCVRALVDTGSPVTIVSLKCLVDILKKRRPPEQSPADWRACVEKRMRPTTLSLQNYGGGEVNLVREMEVTIRRANFTINATIQVQAGAPVDLLLGTDVQPRLGFIFLASDADGSAEELLQGGKWTCDPKSKVKLIAAPATPPPAPEQTKSLDPTNTPVVVNLLQATRLPAQFSKTVRAKVTTRSQTAAIFEPEPGFLTDNNLQMANAVVIPDGGQQVTLIIENHGLTPLKLKKNQVLGHILPADPVDVTEVLHRDESGTPDTPVIAAINRDGGCDSRADQLLDLVEMGEDNLSEEEQTRLKQFLTTNAGVFALDQSELETTDVVTHTVNTGDHSPIRQHPRRTPFALRNQVTEMVKDMLDHQVIQPSSSPWASPIVLVEKKDGSLRFCVDYRRLNSITKMDVFPLPRIDDTLDLLAKSKFFTTLDLRSGYWQVQMEKTSREKTAFVTHSGLYEFLVMPFGLCNAPATFQRLMETVLAGLVGECCLVYLDDILVIGETFEEHLGNLQKVFSRLKEANLRLHPKKCYFASPSVDYLGYHVSAEGLSTDARKTEAVANFSQPMDLKSLRSFLGLASYYRRFIPCFSKIASPLHLLTRKDAPFDWTPACDVAFCQLKQYLTSAPVLAFPLFDREFLLDTDASGLGLGAVLAQKQDDGLVRPIAFASRTLHPHEVNYGSTEMEALAVVWAVKHFRHYLYGHKCQVYTNHEALKSLQNTPHPSGKLARWGLALQEVDLTIHYRPGRVNKNADALSRQPLTDVVEEDNLFGIIANLRVGPDVSSRGGDSNLVDEQRGDPELAEIIQYLSNGVLPDDDKRARELALTKSQYSIVDRVLYHVAKDGTLRIVPPVASREKLCKEAHGGVYGAHLREAKLYGQLSKHYWWPRMRSDIENWCRGCLTCATRQPGCAVKPVLTPIPVSGPFDRVGVDVIHFPKSTSGNSYAVVFVDYLTKWPEVFATPDQTTLTIAKLLVEQIIPRHGVPKELLSDRGPAFLSKVMCDVYRLLGVHKLNTSAYHPRTDGLVERFNRTLTSMLAKTVEKGGKDWDFRLPFVLFAYRSSLQSSTRESPFYLLYGRDPQLPTDAVSDPPVVREVQDVDDYKSRISVYLADAWELAQANVQRAQKQQKLAYDRHARPQAFKPGDRVFVFMPRTKQNKAYKFARAFHGPYRVKEAFETGVVVLPVDRPNQEPIRVAIDRVRRCPRQIPDVFWPSKNKKEPEVEAESQPTCTPATHPSPAPPPETVWSGRLRSRPRTS